mmetsp:Transcript_23154/g.64382  ORF Transcript_23154/g.64382 Transcript_23154/m.64382 type:complete len:199 (-) Transcript_23154:190-786(-)
MNAGALRLVSPQKMLNGLTPLRSILCVLAKENGQIGTAITDPYSLSASPYLNTTNPQDIPVWIRERGVGGVVFAVSSSSSSKKQQNGHTSSSASLSQQQNELLATLRGQIFAESSFLPDEHQSSAHEDDDDEEYSLSSFDMDEATLLGCTVDADEALDTAARTEMARRHVDQWEDAPPSAATDAAIALTRFLYKQQHR